MPVAPILLAPGAPAGEVAAGMAAVRADQGVPEAFPAEVDAEARAAVDRDASAGPAPAATGAAAPGTRRDATALPLVTIDPPGSRDLDQAYAAESRPAGGIRVWYAIADVAAFVAPGGAVDAEAHRRGVTRYGPDRRVPLHPPALSEGAASLLPDGDRPALLWCIDLDADGLPVATRCERAVVRSRSQLTYEEVSRAVAGGTADASLALLRTIGERRLAVEAARGGVSLPLPDQVIVPGDDGHLRLAFDAPTPAEAWNAQVSLLAGIEAARIMLAGGTGLLRTLPAADQRDLARLRQSARALGVAWPADGGYPAFVRSLDPASPGGAALLVQASRALRGAGYRGFRDGDVPPDHGHAAVAASYAHVTAPLRRLSDRAANEVVLAVLAGRDVPEWAASEVVALPEVMADANRDAAAYERAALDLVEALVLRPAVGRRFPAVVVDVDEERAQVQLRDPAVVARAAANGREPGDEVEVEVRGADPGTRTVDLAVV